MREVFEHTADLGLRVRAATFERLCEEAALGLTEIIAGNLAQIRPAEPRTFDIHADSPEYLLFDLLDEVLYAFESKRMLLAEFQVSIGARAGGSKPTGLNPWASGLHVAARGEVYDPARHTLAHEVKAITYHGLEVKRTPEGWEATVIVDI